MSLDDGGDASLCEELFEFCILIYIWFMVNDSRLRVNRNKAKNKTL